MIQRFAFSWLTLVVGLSTAAVRGQETQSATAPCPHCSSDRIVYRDVVTHRCKLVPDTKQIKKTVYEVQDVPFCLPKLPPFLSLFHSKCCDDCPECDCPRYKRVLLKKEIVCEEVCGTKCVLEEVVERVPCRVCGTPCPACSTAAQIGSLPIPMPPIPAPPLR